MPACRTTAILLSLLIGSAAAAEQHSPQTLTTKQPEPLSAATIRLSAITLGSPAPAVATAAQIPTRPVQKRDPVDPQAAPNAATAAGGEVVARLQAIASPTGPAIDRSMVCQAATSSGSGICLYADPTPSSHFGRGEDQQACAALISAIASHLRARIVQTRAYAALQTHYSVAAAAELAAAQLETEQDLDQLEAQQRAAQESGFAVPDPLRIQRLRLQSQDAATQIASAATEARQQMLLLIDAAWACDYAPVIDPPCRCEEESLCDLLAVAMIQRHDLAALRLWQRNLACGSVDCWPTLASMINTHSGCSLPAAVRRRSAIARLIDPRGEEEAIERRRCLVAAAADALEQQIASEVTTAYYDCRTAAERAAVAERLVELGTQRQEQLEQYGDQVAALTSNRLELLGEAASDRIELLRRRHEYRLASLRLQHAIGRTCE